jgi:acetyl esterase/lipase
MREGKKISYGPSDRQFVEVFSAEKSPKEHKSALLVFLHGGAWRSGSTSDHHDLASYVSSTSNITVVLIEYRLSLEGNDVHHPDHINDFYSALSFIFEHDTAAGLGYDPSQAVLAGHSAGGYMTVAAALASDKDQPALRGPVGDMPLLKRGIRQSIKAFVLVVSA